jgi:sulfide:quinone oxidoreductase
MEQPGIRMGKKAYESLGPELGKRGIARQVGVPITRFSDEGVEFADGSALPADLVMFIPAGTGHPVLTGSDLATTEAGFLDIDSGCLVRGTANVYAVGDSAAMGGPDWRAKQGHMAEVMGRVAAHNITHAHEGRNERETYLDEVTLVCLMDVGSGANLVYRTSRREGIIGLPVVGHWAKRAWGWYSGATKLRRFPRIPGL